MNTIKFFIIAMALTSALSPVTSLCAMESDTSSDSDSEQENTATVDTSLNQPPLSYGGQELQIPRAMEPAQAMPMTPEEIAEISRHKRFRAGRTEVLLISLPIKNITDIVLDYAPQTKKQLEQATRNLIKATRENQISEVVAALNDGACTETIVKDADAINPLQRAAHENYAEIAQILFNNKANINANTGVLGSTPLHHTLLLVFNKETFL